MRANTNPAPANYRHHADGRSFRRGGLSAAIWWLCITVGTTSAVAGNRFSADTARQLEGNVLFYNIFVTDHRGFAWTAYDTSLVMNRMRQGSSWLVDKATLIGVPLQIDIQGLNIVTAYSAATGLKQVWICDVLRFLGSNVNPGGDGTTNADGDGACSDDAALWLQKRGGYDHVIIGFHVKGNIGETVAAPDIDNEVLGPIVVYYDETFLFDWKGYAHEFLHEFGACDEYIGDDPENPACGCACDNVYNHYAYKIISENGQTNANCPPCAEGGLACMMRGGAPDAVLCDYTRRQIGWGDSDDDGQPDAIDLHDDLEAMTITAVDQWKQGSGDGQFFYSDVAGGELQVAPRAANVSEYAFAGEMPLPFLDRTWLVAQNGYLFTTAIYSGSYLNYSSVDSIYSRPYEADSLIGTWKAVARGPGASRRKVIAGINGYLYVSGHWGDVLSRLRCARIETDGMLGAWHDLANPADDNRSAICGIAFAAGHIYVAWPQQLDGYEGSRLRIAGAPILPDGSLGEWDDVADNVPETPFPWGHVPDIFDLASDGGGLFLMASVAYEATKIWSTQLAADGSRVEWIEGPALPVWRFDMRTAVAAGRLFAFGGSNQSGPVNDVWMTTIDAAKLLGGWQPLEDLQFEYGASSPGACVTSEANSINIWVGGGLADPGMIEHNDLVVAPLEFGDGFPQEARATYRLPLGAEKELKSIAWRSTDDANVSLRYRTESGGEYTDWEAPQPASEGRIVPVSPILTSSLEVELIARPQKLTRIHDVTVVYTDPNPGSTPAGIDILTTLPDQTGVCRFSSVTGSGTTSAVPVVDPPSPPSGSAIRGAWEITTTAVFEGDIEIGVHYDPSTIISEADLRLLHYAGGSWTDVTTYVDPIARLVWGRVPSLSTFSVIEDTTIVVTGIRDEKSGKAPAFTLDQNVPNPFGPVTTIRFGVASPERVSFRIYDVAGRLVRTLLDTPRALDNQVLEWDGRDEKGNQVSSGVYFYRLQVGSRSLTKKAVLIR